QPFRIDISQAIIDDLQLRLERTRWVDEPANRDWNAGTSAIYLRELVNYWQNHFQWRMQEAALNNLPHFKAKVGGMQIHFIHVRGKGENSMPLVLTHGYPDSFLRFLKLIPLLTDPVRFGGSPQDAFDVVVPSLPGYAFSEKPHKDGTIFHVGDMWSELMTRVLRYKRFGAHGGDWGSMVTEHLARSHSGAVIGIHLTDVPFWHCFEEQEDLSENEKLFLKEVDDWQRKNGAYALVQSTRPQSIAPALNDSPVGLAAWLVEKFREWSDCNGEIESRFSKDFLLTNIMLYWATETINTSFSPYYDLSSAGTFTWVKEKVKEWIGSGASVPTAFSLFPADTLPAPYEWARRFFNIQRWTEMPRGGHFAAYEEPELLANELREFFRPLRETYY
ncbi:MAG TPA: epoxide hydrolase family protein, partial [Chroococcales cyanobacterium]